MVEEILVIVQVVDAQRRIDMTGDAVVDLGVRFSALRIQLGKTARRRQISGVSPNPLTCVSCGQPFPMNGELATIPDARQVAFDPAHRRVWRICATCDEWNLIGVDAAAAALPELTARFAAAVPTGAGDEWLVPAQIGAHLQLLRIGPTPRQGAARSLAMRLRAEVNYRAKTFRRSIYVLVGMAVLWIALQAINLPDLGEWVMSFATVTGGVLMMNIIGKFSGARISNRWLAVNTALFLVASALVATTVGFEHLRYTFVGLPFAFVFLAIGFALTHRYMSVAYATFADGTSVSLSKYSINRVQLVWQPGWDEITFWIGRGRSVYGSDAVLLRQRLRAEIWGGMLTAGAAITERAYDLLRAVGGLRGLLHVLEGYQDERDGGVVVADLPDIYLMALDLALSARPEDDDSQIALRNRVTDAALIAAEAETLDREHRGIA